MDERILVSDQQFSFADVEYAGEFIEFEGTNWCVKANGYQALSDGCGQALFTDEESG